jgi:serine/threonine-protein kinase
MEPLDENDELTRLARARLGERLLDKWLLEDLIGVGGMAAVYAASHRNGKRVAIKILHRSGALNEESRARFLREGLVANAVGHKGAVSVLDEDVTEDGAPFFVMDLFEGETLDSRLRRKGPLPVEEVLSATYHLLDVLAAAHEKKIIHRDVKPENVFLTKDANVKVLDFGIAQLRQTNSTTTKVGHTMGTPSFMAPEQARGRWDEVDTRSDLWSVGATMFTLLTGRHVHEAETLNEVLLGAMTSSAKPITLYRPELPREVCALVDKALAFDKADRWQSAREMQTAIGASYGALRRTSDDLGRAPTLIATSVSSPRLAPIAPEPLPPRTATTARPTARTASGTEAAPAVKGRPRRILATLAAAMAVLSVGSWIAVSQVGQAPRGSSALSSSTGQAPASASSAEPLSAAAAPVLVEPLSSAAAAPAPPATGDPTAAPEPAPTSVPRPRPKHAVTPPSPPPSAAAKSAPPADPLDRRH